MVVVQGPRELKEQGCTIKTVFRPLLIFLQVAGIYCPLLLNYRNYRTKATWKDRVVCFLCLANFIFLILATILAVTKIFETTELTSSLMSRLSHATLSIGTLYAFITMFLFGSRRIQGFLDVLHSYHTKYGTHKYLPRFQRLTRRITIALYFCCFVVPFLTTIYIMCYKDVMVLATAMALPMSGWDSNRLGLAYIMSALVVFTVVLVSIVTLYVVITISLVLEFKSVSKNLKKSLDHLQKRANTSIRSFASLDGLDNSDSCESDSLYDIVGHHRRQHEAVCGILDKANGILCHIMFVIYATVIPLLCFVMYGMIAGSLPLKDFSLMLTEFTLEVISMIIITVMGITLHYRIHEPLRHLQGVSFENAPVQSLQIVSLFTTRLLSQTLGYNVYGMFIIQPSTVLTIVGTLSTYAVVVLQLSPMNAIFPMLNQNMSLQEKCA